MRGNCSPKSVDVNSEHEEGSNTDNSDTGASDRETESAAETILSGEEDEDYAEDEDADVDEDEDDSNEVYNDEQLEDDLDDLLGDEAISLKTSRSLKTGTGLARTAAKSNRKRKNAVESRECHDKTSKRLRLDEVCISFILT